MGCSEKAAENEWEMMRMWCLPTKNITYHIYIIIYINNITILNQSPIGQFYIEFWRWWPAKKKVPGNIEKLWPQSFANLKLVPNGTRNLSRIPPKKKCHGTQKKGKVRFTQCHSHHPQYIQYSLDDHFWWVFQPSPLVVVGGLPASHTSHGHVVYHVFQVRQRCGDISWSRRCWPVRSKVHLKVTCQR